MTIDALQYGDIFYLRSNLPPSTSSPKIIWLTGCRDTNNKDVKQGDKSTEIEKLGTYKWRVRQSPSSIGTGPVLSSHQVFLECMYNPNGINDRWLCGGRNSGNRNVRTLDDYDKNPSYFTWQLISYSDTSSGADKEAIAYYDSDQNNTVSLHLSPDGLNKKLLLIARKGDDDPLTSESVDGTTDQSSQWELVRVPAPGGRGYTQADWQSLADKFCPAVYLCTGTQWPKHVDKYWPASLPFFLDSTVLKKHEQDGIVKSQLSLADLSQYQDAKARYYLDLNDTSETKGSQNVKNGQRDTALASASDTQVLKTPMYVHIRQANGGEFEEGDLDIQYWFFYPYNGKLDIEIETKTKTNDSIIEVITSIASKIAQAFDIGDHVGDWEHVTVRLNKDWRANSTIKSVAQYGN